MTLDEFARIVQAMRTAQKNYFKAERDTPDKHRWLEESKRLEKEVDAACKALLDKQPKLFGE